MSQSIFRKFLFNNDKMNIAFVFVCVLFVFLLFSVIMIGYGGFVYSSYLKTYKTRTIYDLSFGIKKILSDRNLDEKQKPYEISQLFSHYQKDPSISKLWVTDNELRLIYSSQGNIQREFVGKKLPNEYFPLYQKPFLLNDNDQSPVIKKDLGKWETALAMAVRSHAKSQFDFTIGIKMHKFNFFLEPLSLNIWKDIHFNITPALIFLFFLIVSILVSFLLSIFLFNFFDIFEQNSKKFASHVQKIIDSGDFSPTNVKLPVDDTAIFGPLSQSLNTILSKTLANKDAESADRIKKSIADDKTFTHRTIYDALFPKAGIDIKGCDSSIFVSGFNVQSRTILLTKENGSFETSFLLVSLSERDFDQYLLTYNIIRDVFTNWKGKESLVELNSQLLSSKLPYLTAAAGHFNSSDSSLNIWHCGFGSFLIYNSKLDEFVLPSQESLALGKKTNDDLLLLMKEQKLRFDTGDRILFFNNEILTQDVSIEMMKKEISGNPGVLAEDTLNTLISATTATTKNAFYFLIKKR